MMSMKTNSYIFVIQLELKLPGKEWLLKTVLSQNRKVYWYLIYFEISLNFIESSFFIIVNEVEFSLWLIGSFHLAETERLI